MCFHLCEISKKGKAIETKKMPGTWMGEGGGKLTVSGHRRSYWGEKNVLKLSDGGACTTW